MADRFLTAAVFGVVVAAASYALRFLTLSGAVATFCLAVVIYGTGGWQWTIPILAFFVLSSILSKLGRTKKVRFDQTFEKSDTRDGGQVLANGGVAAAVAVFSALFPAFNLFPIYLGALAAVTADTWGTEIGVLTKGKTISLLTLRSVESGTSGGVSEAGTLGGALGAAVIAVSGYAWYSDVRTALIVLLGGVAGSLADSLVGATLQVQFRCEICGKSTERRMHCNQPAVRMRGIGWIGNDAVNWVCGAVGAAAVWGLMLLS